MRYKKTLLAFTALVVSVWGFLEHIGYLGGDVFTIMRPEHAPKPDKRGLTAVILSGDMGFNIGMGPKVAQHFVNDGIPVVGINSLTYFRTRRTVDDVAKLIQQGIDHAFAIPGTNHVVVIGQSFGADMLHAGLTKLSESERRKVLMVALVVPGDTINFRASPSEIFSLEAPDADALLTALQLTWVPVVCIYGAVENNSLCPLITMPNVDRVILPGGHPLRRDDALVYTVLVKAIERVLTQHESVVTA